MQTILSQLADRKHATVYKTGGTPVKLVAQRLPAAVKEGLLSAKVTRVTVSGDTATVNDADITSSRGTLAGFTRPGSPPTMLAKQADGSWKISG